MNCLKAVSSWGLSVFSYYNRWTLEFGIGGITGFGQRNDLQRVKALVNPIPTVIIMKYRDIYNSLDDGYAFYDQSNLNKVHINYEGVYYMLCDTHQDLMLK